MRVVPLVLAVLAAGLASAAPVPKETEAEKIRRLYGKFVDPDRDCTVTLDGSVLKIRVPGRPHGLVPPRGLLNAPRVVRDVEGDFTATVKIRVLAPGGDRPPARFTAGLLVMASDADLVYHARQLDTTRPMPRLSGAHGLVLGGRQTRSGTSGGGIFSAETATFRVHRVKDKVRLAVASGADRWHTMPELTAPFPDRVLVGLYAGQEGATSFTAEFEDFVVVRPPVPARKP